ncbi:hypothetical protein [Nonomuraea polychroma]|nr:hypothetical protein [Nonomuraea polychroma]
MADALHAHQQRCRDLAATQVVDEQCADVHRTPMANLVRLLAMVLSVLSMEDGRGQALVVFLAALIYLATR